MSYAFITALIFAIVAIMHCWRIYNRCLWRLDRTPFPWMCRGLALS